MRCLVCNENGVMVLCFRYKSTVREIAFQRGWSLVVCRTFRDSWLFRGGFANLVLNYPLIGLLAWKVRSWRMEPSTIWSISVEGSTPGSRTVHDSGPKCGGFGSAEWNLPRVRASARMVPLWMLNLP